ncbi:MAG: hypothetical protein IJ054_04110 [Lachnospiraceae bacterium]|nr:hypothetical protein [Lachnospiraceae bacterium]MBQ9234505.1 hypothetical protein [Lachnospiraceae bacterium]
MKIAFYDTKPKDKLLFDLVSKDEDIDVFYIKDGLDESTAKLAAGFDTVCVCDDKEINDRVLKAVGGYGVRAVIIRDEDEKNNYERSKRCGIDIMRIKITPPDKLVNSKWVSYLP